MRQSVSTVRVLTLALLATTAVAATSGCSSWFKKGPRGDYALAPEVRPLEVPPDLNVPDTAGAMKVPALASSAGQQHTTAAAVDTSQSGFVVAGGKDEVFGKVGDTLAQIPGLTVVSRAQMLGSYDVSYEGSNFLVRISANEGGSYVSAVDPRGLPATAEAPVALIALLKAKLGG